MAGFVSFFGRLRRGALVAALGALLVVTGCATPSDDPEELALFQEANDPAEPLNRAIFEFNLFLDKGILRPVASVYRTVLPQFAQDGVRDFLRWLRSPVIFINDILQGKPDRAHETAMRFAANSLGFFGFIDWAGDAGLEFHDEDFGQTLAVWGFGEGPYIMLPVLGPSNVRDTVGFVVDTFIFDPISWWQRNDSNAFIHWTAWLRFGLTAVDGRARNMGQLQELEDSSLDFYAAVRSLYRQRRNDLIRDGAVEDDEALPEFDISFDETDDLFDDESLDEIEEPASGVGPQASIEPLRETQ